MKILPIVITTFAKYLAGGNAFDRMKDAVKISETNGGTGEEKRQAALNIFKAFAFDLASYTVNLLLELAVAWLNSQKPK